MSHRTTFIRATLASGVLAAGMLLAGCNGNVRSGGPVVANVPLHYDMTLEAYKNGQFLLDGALLSPEDLASHFRYLDEQKKLPKTVLLKPSSESGVKDTQLRWFAGLQVTFGFKGYAELDGKLTVVNAQAQPNTKK
ncbi:MULTISPECIES: hypothetical protein [Metallibacterium]|jgi:hypothetical protein|uniref:hypothetical protein n=1 Tax=Metallibacterium TaxID=1218803 RepID=UPI002616B0E2|nr:MULTISPECIES: hypothetical protein [Metallibacterium]MBW8074229.1 hypothetical protein [Metallibacterium scheffleri]